MDQQVDAFAVLDDVFVVARVAGDQHRVAFVVDAVSDSGFGGTVIHRECGDLHAVAVEHDAVLVEVMTDECDFRLSRPRSEVRLVRLCDVGDELLGTVWANDVHLFFSVAPSERQPAGQPEVGQADRMVGMKVSEEYGCNVLALDTGLGKPLHHAAAGIEQQHLVTGLDQRCRVHAIFR